MKPLVVLLAAFAVSLLGVKLYTGVWEYRLAGNLSLGVMLLFTAMGHFAFTKGMTMMLPDFVPFKSALVYLTGVIELAAAIGLQIDAVRQPTAVSLIAFFVLLLPANIYAALRGVDFQKGSYTGPGIGYLWFRVPLQVLFIGWVYFFSLYL